MPTFSNSEGGSSVRTKINDAITLAEFLSFVVTNQTASGAGAPSSTPGGEGYIYVDTTNDLVYMSVGTASSADWQVVSNVIWFDAGGSSSAARPTTNTKVLVIWTNHGTSNPTNAQSQDIIAGPGPGIVVPNTQTGTSYTLVLDDAGVPVHMNNASANTVTVPTNASVAFGTGTVIPVAQRGAGVTTITGDTGVTINGTSAGSAAINNRYQGATLHKVDTNEWLVQGDVT